MQELFTPIREICLALDHKRVVLLVTMTAKALDEAIRRTFSAYGKIGGRSRSAAKRAASKLNAAKAAAARRKKPGKAK